MLTDHEKKMLKRKWLRTPELCFTLFHRIVKPDRPSPPELACVYAAEMSDDTTKIGVSTNHDKRIKQIKGQVYLDVKRAHHTAYAPLEFMRVIEARCHATFADRQVRGEFFDISFEEAVTELNKHAADIADALHKADQRYLDELDYFFNEFLPEYEGKILNKSTETKIPKYNQEVTHVRESKTAVVDDNENSEIIRLKKQLSDLEKFEFAVVYVLLMSNGTVKIGMTKDLTERVKQLKAETGLYVLKFRTTPFMPREEAAELEAKLKEMFAAYCMGGEYFDVKFTLVCAALQ